LPGRVVAMLGNCNRNEVGLYTISLPPSAPPLDAPHS